MVKGLRFTGSRLKGMLHLAAIVSLLIGIFVPFGQIKAEGALTVAEALQGQSSGGTVTVEGYIVGHATGSKTANFSSPFANDFNVLIADQANERSTSNLLDVQLTSAYRGQFGLTGHPELIGSKIRVTGTLGAYNNFGGVKSPSAVELVNGSEPGNQVNLVNLNLATRVNPVLHCRMEKAKRCCSIIRTHRPLAQQIGSLTAPSPTLPMDCVM